MNRVKLGIAALSLSFLSMAFIGISDHVSGRTKNRNEVVSPTAAQAPANPSDPKPTPMQKLLGR